MGAIDTLCRAINDAELTNNVMQLQTQLYSNKKTTSDLTAIVKLLKKYQAQTLKSQQAVLKDLYH